MTKYTKLCKEIISNKLGSFKNIQNNVYAIES